MGRRLLETAVAVVVLVALVLALPGLGNVRGDLAHAAPGWMAARMRSRCSRRSRTW